MTDKNENTDIILKYLEKNASPEEIQQLRTWVAQSKQHADYFQEIRNIWDITSGGDPETIDVKKALEKVKGRINLPPVRKRNTEAEEASRKKTRFITYFQRIAAILILPVLIALGVYISKSYQQPPLIAFNEVVAPYGMVSNLTLPDGSKVWLNGGSSLKYPTAFAEKVREVEMSGEAYFEVHADKEHPFTVNTGTLKVTATGTAFNVSSFAKSKEETVTLIQGKVSVANDKTVKQLLPGQQLNYEKGSAEMKIMDIDPFQYISWKDGILAFRDDPLEVIFRRLEQAYHVRFILKDSSINKYTYRATFKDETLNDILNYMEMSIPITFRKVETGKEEKDSINITTIEVCKN